MFKKVGLDSHSKPSDVQSISADTKIVELFAGVTVQCIQALPNTVALVGLFAGVDPACVRELKPNVTRVVLNAGVDPACVNTLPNTVQEIRVPASNDAAQYCNVIRSDVVIKDFNGNILRGVKRERGDDQISYDPNKKPKPDPDGDFADMPPPLEPWPKV